MCDSKMTVFKTVLLSGIAALLAAVPGVAAPQAAPAPKAAPSGQARPAAAKPPSPVDSVIQLVKSGMSESLIIKSLQKQNKPMDLTPADMVKLKNAGVSENIMGVMIDPTAAPAATPAPAPAAAAAPPPAPAPEPAPAPVASSAPASAPAASGPVSAAQKKRVIVDEFDYSAVMTSVQAVFGTQQNIGKGIRAMLTTRLAQQGKVVIVERAKVNALMKEQDFNASNRVKQGSGARVGQISGADAQLSGDIIIFGRDDKKTRVKGGGIIGGVIGGIASANDQDKAVVAISYRLIDAETSEIIATGEARGESVRKSKGFGGMGGAWGKGVAGVEVDMTSSNFAQTIIGEATQDCVNKLADILNQQTEGMKKAVRPVEARVADVSGGSLVISAGANDGVNVGETFEILKVLREVRDPVTKEVLDTVTQKLGEMTITNVRDKIATGSYSGPAPKVGDIARKKL
ncbi:MAG TPA: CsgG/HfaB family protein [Bryobacteraceae bacterium]|nr:CsgG/HfaB family protein [Bryobacteraceae bacterium]